MRITRSELDMVTNCRTKGVWFFDYTEAIEKFLSCNRYWEHKLEREEKDRVGYQLLDELKTLNMNHSWFYWLDGDSGKYSFSFTKSFNDKFNKLHSFVKSTKYLKYFFDFIEQTNLSDDYRERIKIKKSYYTAAQCEKRIYDCKLLEN